MDRRHERRGPGEYWSPLYRAAWRIAGRAASPEQLRERRRMRDLVVVKLNVAPVTASRLLFWRWYVARRGETARRQEREQ